MTFCLSCPWFKKISWMVHERGCNVAIKFELIKTHSDTIFTEHEKVWEDQSNVELVEENNKIIF